MINTIEQFGRNAGSVWHILADKKSLPLDKIAAQTHLRMYEVEIAIGWLARENKISCINNHYSLGPTNLINSIGTNAGILFNLFNTSEKTSMTQIIKHTSLPLSEIYKAIGWLAKENKISIEI